MSVETTAPPAVASSAPQPESARRDVSPWLLGVCCVAQFMVILDLSIVNVALPSIQFSLGFTAPDLQWVVDAYAITFAGFLMFGGRAADHFGQRRTFVAALALFGLASLAGGIAPDQGLLIGARAVQGLAGALMAACSLAIITASFPPKRITLPRPSLMVHNARFPWLRFSTTISGWLRVVMPVMGPTAPKW